MSRLIFMTPLPNRISDMKTPEFNFSIVTHKGMLLGSLDDRSRNAE
jgi:hypothetical protein